jgi:ATP phosphoribosyltransferase regulatory subunit HisZ
MTTNTKQFRYPIGAKPLLIEETARRRRIESRFVSILETAGFAEIVLPIIDFADPYASVGGADTARQSYRFTDRDGELVAIRSDFTPMVARALAPSLEEEQLPLRVFYRGDVIRCEASRLGTNRELFQIGAELIGDASVEADAEMLQLAASLVDDPLVVVDVVRCLLPVARAAAEQPGTGNRQPETGNSVEALLAHDRRFSFVDEPRTNDTYYTGLRFWLYSRDRRTPVAQGGRYDSLYSRFGAGAPAVGFTFTVDSL